MKLYLIIASIILFVSCRQNNATTDLNAEKVGSSQTSSAQIENYSADTIITTPCAIFIHPADNKIDSMKKINEEDFYIVADDNIFYLSKTMHYLDSMKTKCIDLKSMGTIKFQLADKRTVDINLSEFFWGVLLFNGKTEPIEGDITNINADYRRYMTNE